MVIGRNRWGEGYAYAGLDHLNGLVAKFRQTSVNKEGLGAEAAHCIGDDG
jgi:hypothetical protein